MVNEKRLERLKKLCNSINNGSFGGRNKDAVTCLGISEIDRTIEKFSCGCASLDDALGGGWPKGRIIELYGAESTGKSSVCLHTIAEHQKKYNNEDVGIVDAEFALDTDYAEKLGVDTDSLIICQPDSGDQALNVVRQFIEEGVKLIVVDSVAALTPQAEIDGDIGDQGMGQQARLMSQAMRILSSTCSKHNATIIFTNQTREKIGQMGYGEKITTPGGKALKFYASIRLELVRIGTNKEGDIAVSNRIKAKVKKNKVAPPFRETEFVITFGKGIDANEAFVELIVAKGVVKKTGAWFKFEGENVAQGKPALKERLVSDPDFRTKLQAKLDELKDVKVEVVEDKNEEKPEGDDVESGEV